MKTPLMVMNMTEEMLTIIKDNQEHLQFLHEKLWDAWVEYNQIKDKIKKKETVLKKLLEEAMPTLAKY